MSYTIIYDHEDEAIRTMIDRELGGRPCENDEYERIYQMLLNYVHAHGHLPMSFTLKEEP